MTDSWTSPPSVDDVVDETPPDVEPEVEEAGVVEPEPAPEPKAEPKPKPRSRKRVQRTNVYTLEAGDNPSVVARKLYGRGSRARELVIANPGVKWKPGVEIQLP